MLQVSPCFLLLGGMVLALVMLGSTPIVIPWAIRMINNLVRLLAESRRPTFVGSLAAIAMFAAVIFGGFRLVSHIEMVPCGGKLKAAAITPTNERPALAMCTLTFNQEE